MLNVHIQGEFANVILAGTELGDPMTHDLNGSQYLKL